VIGQGAIDALAAGAPVAAALALAARGMPVFPCNPDPASGKAKSPLVPKESAPGARDGGLYLATTDEAQIRAWWARTPNALIGMPTGPRSGTWVLDLDPKAHRAQDMLSAVSAFVGVDLAHGPRVLTQSGGLHLYFRYPDLADGYLGNRADLFRRAIPDADSPIHRHVDTRGEGGYVIVPPSVMRNGRAYAWQGAGETADIPHAPPRLLDLVLRRGEFAGAGAASSDEALAVAYAFAAHAESPGDKAVRAYARAAMDRVRGDVSTAPTGARGATLNAAAFTLGQFVAAGVLSSREASAALQDGADACGLTATDGARERDAKIRRGIAAGSREAGKLEARLSQIRAEAEERAARYDRRLRPPPPAADDYGTVRTIAAPRDAAGDEPKGEDRDSDRPPDDDALADEAEGSDAPSGPPLSGIDRTVVRDCVPLDHSDTDNGKRLIAHFGRDLAVWRQEGIRNTDYVAWCGTHWDMIAGNDRAFALAQGVGPLIAMEADEMSASPAEREAITHGNDAAAALATLEARRSDWTDEDKSSATQLRMLVDLGKNARAALAQRKQARRKFGVSSKNKARLEAMLACAAPMLVRAPEEFNKDPYRLATARHTLRFARMLDPENPDLDGERWTATLTAREGHRRGDYITRLLPALYDADASCERWDAFLARFLPDETVREFVKVYCGLSLLGVPVQRLLFHYGVGANGKSVFLEVLSRILGSLAVNLPAESITSEGSRGAGQASPDIARLVAARFVRITELPAGQPLDEALVKRLTGGEKMDVRGLFKGYFSFDPVFKAHMSGNAYPRIDGTDNGIWRRISVVHWPVTLALHEQRDFEQVVAGFVAEASGILNWLVSGALTFLREGLVVPEAVRAATSEYRDEMDPVGQFFGDCVTVTGLDTDRVQARVMYDAYVAWSVANAKRPKTETAFGRIMPGKVPRDDGGRIKSYVGCVLHDVPLPPDAPRSPGDSVL
jgi:putative DNA primase/helicase